MDDIDAVKAKFLKYEFEHKDFEVDAEAVAAFARACGETAPRFVVPSTPRRGGAPGPSAASR